MLNGNRAISRTEHRLFFWLTFLGLALRLVELAVAFVFPTSQAQGTAIYDIFDMWELMSPIYSVMAFIIAIPCSIKVSIPSLTCSLIPIALLMFFFDRWFIDTRHMVRLAAEVNPTFEFKTFDFAVSNGSIYDFLTLLLVNGLLAWQISMLVRLLRSGVK